MLFLIVIPALVAVCHGFIPTQHASFVTRQLQRSSSPLALNKLYERSHASLHMMSDSSAVPAAIPKVPKADEKIPAKTLKKLIPLGMMFFCILFNYTILRYACYSSYLLFLMQLTCFALIIETLKTFWS